MTSSALLHKRFFWSALTFCVLCFISLVLLMVNNSHKATILVTPTQSDITMDWNVSVTKPDIAEASNATDIIGGEIVSANIFQTKPVVQNPDQKSSGTITVFNGNSREQTLVATTRFLSENNVLFRIPKQITVPAGGSIETTVIADVPGPQGDIGPTTFSIPGLSQALQELVYATSSESFTGGTPVSMKSYVLVENLDNWLEPTAAYLQEQVSNPLIIMKDTLSKTSDENGAVVRGLGTDPAMIRQKAQRMISSSLPSGYTLDDGSIQWSVKGVSYNPEESSAVVTFAVSARTELDPESLNIEWKNIEGKSIEDATRYMGSIPGIQDVEIKMQPGWRDIMPAYKKNISITVATIEKE